MTTALLENDISLEELARSAKVRRIEELIRSAPVGGWTVTGLAQAAKCSRPTASKYLRRAGYRPYQGSRPVGDAEDGR